MGQGTGSEAVAGSPPSERAPSDHEVPEPANDRTRAAVLRRRLPDVAGLVWVVASAVTVLVPALTMGLSLGSYDLLAQLGLTAHPQAMQGHFLDDVIQQMLETSVRAGRHRIELHHRPDRFTVGLWLAAAGAVAVLVGGVGGRRRRLHADRAPHR